MDSPSFDPVLFGQDPTLRVVAVEKNSDSIEIFRRLEDNSIKSIFAPFKPWLIHYKNMQFDNSHLIVLDGEGYNKLFEFNKWSDYLHAKLECAQDDPQIVTFASPQRQYLTRSGITLFKNMQFDELHRMQVDIETVDLEPNRPEHKVLMIGISDNRGLEITIEGEEKSLLEQFIDLFNKTNPDVIEGHNIFSFDLPYLAARCKINKIKFAIGRDGSEMYSGQKRNYSVAGNSRPFVPLYIYGRHILDTFLSVRRYDLARGSLNSYGLKECAETFGIAEKDRILVERENMSKILNDTPDILRTYCIQDVRETKRLADLVLPTEFYQTQMAPESYQQSAVMGTGEKINLFMIRAYLNAGCSIPFAQQGVNYQGGYTEILRRGVIHNVVKADVESLYPSIMMRYKIAPKSDHLDVFLPMLSELTKRRLEAKMKMRIAVGAEMNYWNGLQGSYKVLINSFYGVLGARFYFNDYEAADKITKKGRELVLNIAALLIDNNAEVIEIDTDGVFFKTPIGCDTEEKELELISKISEQLPVGIKLSHDGRYKSMVSVKIKNYALLTFANKILLTGSSLRSRADEKYGRKFLEKAFELLFQEKYEELSEYYNNLMSDIKSGNIDINQLSRRERITDKTFNSTNKHRSATLDKSRGMMIGDYLYVYQTDEGALQAVENYNNDEDRNYYCRRLYQFALRLQDAFDDQFDILFPNPFAAKINKDQQIMELFD